MVRAITRTNSRQLVYLAQDRSNNTNYFQETLPPPFPSTSPTSTCAQDLSANLSPQHISSRLFTFSLYAKGRVLGFKRAKRNQRPDISLVQIEGVKTAADTEFYLGKRVAFVYRAKREVNGSKIRCIWGRITRAHGGSGAVKARFRNNLPAKSFGASVRVMMYPSRV
ncbi:60S ribosomal protein L33A [Linnemannia elongata]|nr:60S ribosomal protein L33A [Linnemannia elongata]